MAANLYSQYPWLTPGWNPSAGRTLKPQPGGGALGGNTGVGLPGGTPGTTTTNLPGMIAKNPKAYAQLVSGQYIDPLAVAATVGPLKPEYWGHRNIIFRRSPDYAKAAGAAALAQYANQRRRKSLEEALGVPAGQQTQTTPAQVVNALAGVLGPMGDPTPLPAGMQGPPQPAGGLGQAAGALGGWLGKLGGVL